MVGSSGLETARDAERDAEPAGADTFDALLARAEAARAANALADGLAAAGAAWARSLTAEQKRRSRLLLAHFQYRSGVG